MTLKDETIFSLIVAELLGVEGRLENLKFCTEESRTLFQLWIVVGHIFSYP